MTAMIAMAPFEIFELWVLGGCTQRPVAQSASAWCACRPTLHADRLNPCAGAFEKCLWKAGQSYCWKVSQTKSDIVNYKNIPEMNHMCFFVQCSSNKRSTPSNSQPHVIAIVATIQRLWNLCNRKILSSYEKSTSAKKPNLSSQINLVISCCIIHVMHVSHRFLWQAMRWLSEAIRGTSS
jgi:hypothetical protein